MTHQSEAQRRQLRQVRWAVRTVLGCGVAASLAANVMHAHPNEYSRVIAAWPPMALFATIEVISRVPIHRPILAATRVAATVCIGGIAAWVSYWHMAAVVADYGEHGITPYLLPISVDGLVIVASISLFELADRIRTLTGPDPDASRPSGLLPVAAAGYVDPGPPDPPTAAVTVAVGADANLGFTLPPSPTSAEVAVAVAQLRATRPNLDIAGIAALVHRSPRQVSRILQRRTLHADDSHVHPPSTVNGHKPS